MLEVVQHEQRRALTEVVQQLVPRREAAVRAIDGELDRLGDGGLSWPAQREAEAAKLGRAHLERCTGMLGAPRNAHRGAPSIWLLLVLVFVVTYPEREDRRRVEGLSCIQDRGGEVRLVRRVREVLGLERVPRG